MTVEQLTLTFSHKKEISRITKEIRVLENLKNDHKRLAAGDYTKAELDADIEELVAERNLLLKFI